MSEISPETSEDLREDTLPRAPAQDAPSLPRDGYECDVIMKGGIASGIVYPTAIQALSKTYWFRSIGGASSGAIVAAATAAAELRRRRNPAIDAFADLAWKTKELSLPSSVSGKTRMEMLFQPAEDARPVFDTLLAAVSARNPKTKVSAFVAALLRNFWVHALLWLLLGSTFFVWLFLEVNVRNQIGSVILWIAAEMGLLLALAIVVVGVFVTPLLVFFFRASKALTNGFMGLCTGMPPDVTADAPSATTEGRDLALSEWLHQTLNQLSGKDELNATASTPGVPLTFGDLRAAPLPEHLIQEGPGIDLQIITTNLTQGQPYRIPFAYDHYYFDPDEMRMYFPATVVDWMVNHPRIDPPRVVAGSPGACTETPISDERPRSLMEEDRAYYGQKRLCRLPSADDLPVVVAVRLSICFPILLSAVPLYAVDHSLKDNRIEDEHGRIVSHDEIKLPQATRCYFSDGGICSNLPLQFFDNFLPNRPTFAINLRPFHPERPYDDRDQSRNVSLPCTNDSPPDYISRPWPDKISGSGFGTVFGYLGSVINTARNWADDMQCVLPGYRDRVVVIHLREEEGGLNLKMSATEIAKLEERGAAAGNRLVEHFASAPPPDKIATTWDNHRWIRLRTMIGKLQEVMRRVDKYYTRMPMTSTSYQGLLARNLGDSPVTGFPYQDAAVNQQARRLFGALHTRSGEWQSEKGDFNENLPDPATELQIRPKL